MPIFNDNLQTIGGTPLVRIQRLTAGLPGRVLVKIEGRNPAYSVKCRIGAAMIWDAEKRGILKPGVRVIEATVATPESPWRSPVPPRGID